METITLNHPKELTTKFGKRLFVFVQLPREYCPPGSAISTLIGQWDVYEQVDGRLIRVCAANTLNYGNTWQSVEYLRDHPEVIVKRIEKVKQRNAEIEKEAKRGVSMEPTAPRRKKAQRRSGKKTDSPVVKGRGESLAEAASQ